MAIAGRGRRLAWPVFALAVAAWPAAPAGAANERVGVNAAVNTDATGTPPGAGARKLVVGQEIVHNERIVTDANGQTQILFVDGSSVSVGPNSELTIDEYVFDPATGTGRMTLTAVQGAMRFVGGKLSKHEDAVSVHLGTATIGVRGGVFIAEKHGDKGEIIFVYGKALKITGANGTSEELFRPGFAVEFDAHGNFSTPHLAPAGSTVAILTQLDGQSGKSGGAVTVPTDATVVSSGVPTVISNNVTQSVQQATQNNNSTPAPTPTTTTAQPSQVPQNQVQTTSSQTQTTNTPSPPPPPPPQPPAVVKTIAGAFKTAKPPALANNVGFNKTGIGYNGASLSYPTTALQNGTASLVATVSNGTVKLGNNVVNFSALNQLPNFTGSATASLTGLLAGATTQGAFGLSSLILNGVDLLNGNTSFNGITDNNGVITGSGVSLNLKQILGSLATGTVTTTADGDFFYANLLLNDPALVSLLPSFTSSSLYNAPIFVMGGTPVAPSFFTAMPATPQFYAFAIQPDFTLANGSKQQTIPFLPSFSGGTMTNATVSPLLVVNNANTPFGSHNNVSNPNALGTTYLQANLAINGTGMNQTSALVVTTGGFSTSSDNGQVIASGSVRGTVFTGASSPMTIIDASAHSVTDGNGNSLFGGNSIDGFLLDQNKNTLTGNFAPNIASSIVYQSGIGFTTTNFNFNQPVTATNLPTGIGATRSMLNETGFFGGAMQCCSTNTTTDAITNYGLAGTVSLQTDPNSSRLAATFTAGGPFISTASNGQSPLTASGLDAITLRFGSLPSEGLNYGRSTFIDNNTFAAAEDPDTASIITRNNSSGVPTTTTLPTLTSATNSNFAPSLALVTSSVVPNNALLPGGVLCAQCQYSQWGYWTGRTVSPNTSSGFAGQTTNDVASINTWIAGTPTVTMPTSAVGNYSGNAIGTVYNAGAQYLAVGGVLASYNFATNTGTLTISNFDGNTLSGILGFANGSSYSASLTGPNGLAGTVNGSFYGPNAAETGGNFGFGAPSGSYFASGIYDAASTGTSSALPAFTISANGGVKNTNTNNGNATPGTGFSIQTGTGRELYTSGTVSFPAGATLAGATAAIATPNTGDPNCPCTLSSLTPGSSNAVTSTNGMGQSFTGIGTMSPDGNFFVANVSGNGDQAFIFGGTPVNQNFYAGNQPAQILAFQIQPDAALANGSQPQTIPFLPPAYGGLMANASVSNFYVGSGANSPFGLANASNGYVEPKALQASLVFNGQGANQTSALVVATGNFFDSSGTQGLVAFGGPVRGTVMTSANASPVHISSGIATVPDGSGNNLFGGNTLDGFVLDQNSYNFNGTIPLSLQLASAAQFGQSTVSYAFNQAVTATSLPGSISAGTRENLNETGYFGGLMTSSSNTSAPGNPYVLSGTTAVQSTASNYRVAATFTGGDPFTASQSGINSMSLAFGALNQNIPAGTNSSRGTYINDNVYAATDSPITASSINGHALALPPNSTSSTPSPSIAMVTSGTVPAAINAILPNGVTPCTCNYLQWGYWTGQVSSTPTQGLMTNRADRGYINTWVAGTPTVTMPTVGSGTYSGAAVGTVFNGTSTYVAAGGFSNTYNFGSNTGVVSISNFDGANYTANVSGGKNYNGVLTGVANRSGAVNGTFYGPGAAETGGNFAIHAISGSPYLASGIVAGQLTGPIH